MAAVTLRRARNAVLPGILFVLTGAVLMLPSPRAQASDPVAITSGSITWGVKSSFRSYVTGPIASGSISVSGFASLDGTVPTFSQGAGTWSSDGATLATSGTVRFVGHSGELDLSLSNPELVISGTSGSLRVDATDSEGKTTAGLAIGSVDLTGAVKVDGDTVTITSARVLLTTAGRAVFSLDGASFYAEGEAMDPVSASFTVATQPNPSAGSTDAGSGTQSPSGVPSVTATSSASASASATATASASASSSSATPAAIPSRSSSGRTAGWLSWGVKQSFRSYVTGPIAHGSITVSGGAKAVSGGYRFGQSATSADPPAAAGTTSYRGLVRFAGHAGAMNLTFSAPRVQITSGSSAMLSVAVSGFGRVGLARLDLSAATRRSGSDWVSWSGAPATLTAAGTKVFSYNGSAFYPAGTTLDPVTFVVGATASASGGTTTITSADTSATATATATTSASATPSASTPSPTAGLPATATCEITAAGLTWGFKESFRAYVTGSIANGEWTTSDGADYHTPAFSWTDASGALSPAADAGLIAFTGTVRFTGHKGAMDTTIANPQVRLDRAGHATLLLDVSGVSMAEAMAGGTRRTTATAVPFADLDLTAGSTSTAGETVTLSGVPATLTAAGHDAFPNYEAGAALDSLTLTWTATGCAAATPQPSVASPTPVAGDTVGLPALAAMAGSGAIGAAIGSTITLLVARRWWVQR